LAPACRILVIRLGSLGDVIHTLPAAASLRHSFAQSRLSWVIKPQWAPLLEANPYVDRVIPFERTAGGLRALWGPLRSQRFDLTVDFQGLIQSALVAALAKGDKIVGLARTQARESLAALFYSSAVRTAAAHRVDQNLELAAAAGATSLLRTFPLPLGRPEGDLPGGRFVLACPLAGWQWKQWPWARWAEFARMLVAETGMPLVVNGPPQERDALAGLAGARLHISSVSGLIDATRRATAVVGVDSGPLHLAAALGKPGAAVYGPTDPASHGPYGGTIRVLRAAGAQTTYKRRDEANPAMAAIGAAQVLDALRASLDAQGEKAAPARNRP
jgi:heptosyltransferase-1